MLKASGIDLERLDVSYPEVQADTLEEVVENALDWLSSRYGQGLVVDDSGLFVSTLKGFPGVYSSYVFRTIGCEGILSLLAGAENREATFVACFGLAAGDERHIFKGEASGAIADEMRGTGGFGFDPIFVPDGHQRTFAEMTLHEKNEVSHRGRAVEKLALYLKGGRT